MITPGPCNVESCGKQFVEQSTLRLFTPRHFYSSRPQGCCLQSSRLYIYCAAHASDCIPTGAFSTFNDNSKQASCMELKRGPCPGFNTHSLRRWYGTVVDGCGNQANHPKAYIQSCVVDVEQAIREEQVRAYMCHMS